MQEPVDLDPVRGMRDHLPADQERLAALRGVLEAVSESWGYAPVDLPVLERRELYLKKSGEDLVGKLYDFSYNGRALALRPEWTASVLRAYLRGLQSEPLPLRLRYCGPVFRYERPQRLTYRQFIQLGVEMIGGAAPRADAEIVVLACKGLADAGVQNWTLTLGHVGIARAMLAHLPLPQRTASQLLWSMDRLQRGDLAALRTQLQASGALGDADNLFDLGPLVALPDDQLAELLATTVRAMGLSLEDTSRPADAIIQRLIRKLRRADPGPAIEHALVSLERLSQARGEPAVAFDIAARLLDDLNLPSRELEELRRIVDLVQSQGIEPPRLQVNLGLGRGLHYYSGMIFEIEGANGLQLCGGGRYDELVGALQRGPSRTPAGADEARNGARRVDVPAVGFAYGLERVAAAGAQLQPALERTVLVVASDDDFKLAMRAAETLRRQGYRTLLDSRGRSLQANLRDAERRGCAALVAVDSAAPDGELTWHALSALGEPASSRRMPLAALDQEASL